MARIDINEFNKIVQRYGCEKKVFADVRRYVLNNYCLTFEKQSGRCLIMIQNNSDRRFFFRKKFRFFQLEFIFWGIPEDLTKGQRSFIHLGYESSEEISFKELKRRAILTKPEDEALNEAENIINPDYVPARRTTTNR